MTLWAVCNEQTVLRTTATTIQGTQNCKILTNDTSTREYAKIETKTLLHIHKKTNLYQVAEQLFTHNQHSENIQITRKGSITETLRLVSLHTGLVPSQTVISFSPLWSCLVAQCTFLHILHKRTTVVVITHLCRTYTSYFHVHLVNFIYHTQSSNIQLTAMFCNWCLKTKFCTKVVWTFIIYVNTKVHIPQHNKYILNVTETWHPTFVHTW
jgi:hypothetical protein